MRRRLSSSINNVVSNMRLEGAMEILPQVVFVVSGLKEKVEELGLPLWRKGGTRLICYRHSRL
jgi:hypothetical protein